MAFFVILGLIHIIIAFFLLTFDLRILIKGERAIGEICDLRSHCHSSDPGSFNIEVQFNRDGRDIKLVTLNSFYLTPFFMKFKISRLRKKHIGRPVHIYYDLDNNTQALIREYMWKEFLRSAFLFFLGVIVVLAGIYKWY